MLSLLIRKIYINIFLIFLISICLILVTSCEEIGEKIGKKVNPFYPNKAQTHIVELFKVQISEIDFNRSTFDNPLAIRVSLYENGKRIHSKLLSGRRGERLISPPIQWIVNFSPQNNYQIRLVEQSVIADAIGWSIPGTPKIGYWPIAKGKMEIGNDSYFYFSDKIAK